MLRNVEIVLVGTGGPRGWPEPGCPCASCALATAAPRAPLEVVVDGSRVPLASGPLGDGTALLALDGSAVEAVADAYAVVLLADGDPALLAGLRRSGAVGPDTVVVAVALTHLHRPERLGDSLAERGVLVVPDGSRVHGLRPPPAPPRRTLVLGGARSGKSAEAERRLLGEPAVVYVATAPPREGDAEWAERLRTHRDRRPARWSTVETFDLEPLLAADGEPLLVDDLGLWLTRVLDEHAAWEGGSLQPVRARVDRLVAAWRATRRRVVAVSPEVGLGVVPATRSGRLFQDELGRLNAAVARESERVVQVVAGRVTVL